MKMQLVTRSVVVSARVAAFLLVFALRWLGLWLAGRRRRARQALFGRSFAGLCRRLGTTFIKLAQVLATRADLLSQAARDELSQLHEHVGPFPYEQVRATVTAELGRTPEDLFALFDPYPVASASVAQVHHGKLADGREVAVKVLRPRVEQEVEVDLKVMRVWSHLVAWLPVFRLLSPVAIVEQFARALRDQLDLRIEAANNRRFASNFAHDPSVVVPQLHDTLCGRRVLTMEFVHGERVLAAGRDDAQRRRLALAGYRMMLKMVFADGFVHADLHPGNIYVSAGRLVLFDVGLVAELGPVYRTGLVDLCLAWVARDVARACAAIERIAFLGTPRAPERLQRQVSALMDRYGDVTLAEIQVGSLLLDLMRLVHGQGVRLDPFFTMTALSIAVVEGVGRQLAPGLQLMEEALPFFQQHLGPRDRPVAGG